MSKQCQRLLSFKGNTSHCKCNSSRPVAILVLSSLYPQNEGKVKGCLRFCYGGGELHIFFWLQNAKSRDRGIVWTSKLYRQTLWTHPALLGLCLVFFDVKIKTYARLIKVGEKMHFLETRQAGVPRGVPKVKIVKNLPIKVQSPQKSIYSTPIHLKPIIRPKSWKSGLVHFPLGFSCKKFQNFSKIFFAQNCIKRYLRYMAFPP